MDKLFAKKTVKQTGLFGQAPRIPKNEDQEMEIDQGNQEDTKPKFVPWVEKYRPNKIEEISH